MKNDNMPDGRDESRFDDTVGVVYGGPLPEFPVPVRPGRRRWIVVAAVAAIVTAAALVVFLCLK